MAVPAINALLCEEPGNRHHHQRWRLRRMDQPAPICMAITSEAALTVAHRRRENGIGALRASPAVIRRLLISMHHTYRYCRFSQRNRVFITDCPLPPPEPGTAGVRRLSPRHTGESEGNGRAEEREMISPPCIEFIRRAIRYYLIIPPIRRLTLW